LPASHLDVAIDFRDDQEGRFLLLDAGWKDDGWINIDNNPLGFSLVGFYYPECVRDDQ
jgi:hypothetical protein